LQHWRAPLFKKATLILRDRIKRIKRIPFFLKPAVGAAMNWLIGISVFFAIGKIGVFGLGYGDLEKMFYGSISGPQAILLAIAKFSCDDCRLCLGRCWRDLFAYLFFGAAIGLAFIDICGLALHLQVNDRIALTVAGMSACLGALVRAPITSILIVFADSLD
jgi:CIC family chloride channel protein